MFISQVEAKELYLYVSVCIYQEHEKKFQHFRAR